MTCPDCKGTGEYVGLIHKEPCATCHGTGVSTALAEARLSVNENIDEELSSAFGRLYESLTQVLPDMTYDDWSRTANVWLRELKKAKGIEEGYYSTTVKLVESMIEQRHRDNNDDIVIRAHSKESPPVASSIFYTLTIEPKL